MKKKNVLLIIGLFLVVLPLIIYVILTQTHTIIDTIKLCANNNNVDEIINNVNKYVDSKIYLDLLFYLIFQILNYGLYLFKKEKAIIISLIIEGLVAISFSSIGFEIKSLILFIPLINGLIYYYIFYAKLDKEG